MAPSAAAVPDRETDTLKLAMLIVTKRVRSLVSVKMSENDAPETHSGATPQTSDPVAAVTVK
jgi:hypothetical protein